MGSIEPSVQPRAAHDGSHLSRSQRLAPTAILSPIPALRYSIASPDAATQQRETYRNPVLSADYPDPDVIRDGTDFYMVVSSFHCTPGLPILHSQNLVDWSLINHAACCSMPALKAPLVARPLSFDHLANSFCPATTLASLPPQAACGAACKARP